MIRLCLFYLTCFTFSFASAQIDKPSATAKVNVSDFQNNPRAEEIILFMDMDSNSVIQGQTNGEGNFEIKLEGNTTYQIKIKGFSEDQDYSEVTIPEIKEGQKVSFTINIQFDPPRTFSLHNVNFDLAKSSLKKESFAELNELVEYLELKESVRVEIAGHTDNQGDEKSNQSLSQKRSETVRNYLISKGIDSSRIVAKGYGESKPIADNGTEEGRQKNRRTEVHILD